MFEGNEPKVRLVPDPWGRRIGTAYATAGQNGMEWASRHGKDAIAKT
jgi:hypothetical protein